MSRRVRFITGFRSTAAQFVRPDRSPIQNLNSRDLSASCGIHRRTALGTHFAAHRIHGARPFVQPAGRGVFQHLELRRISAEVREPAYCGGPGRRSALVAECRARSTPSRRLSCREDASTSAPIRDGTCKVRSCSRAERAITNTTMRKASSWSLIRVRAQRLFRKMPVVWSIQAYPFRFSLGVQQQTFYSFAGGSKNTILPVVHFTLF